jgi:hypothetical protein
LELPARSFRLLVLRATPGPLWTDSKVSALRLTPGAGLSLAVGGPSSVPGMMKLATPPPSHVTIDGVALTRAQSPSPNREYAYDPVSGVLSLEYEHRTGRSIEVTW